MSTITKTKRFRDPVSAKRLNIKEKQILIIQFEMMGSMNLGWSQY